MAWCFLGHCVLHALLLVFALSEVWLDVSWHCVLHALLLVVSIFSYPQSCIRLSLGLLRVSSHSRLLPLLLQSPSNQVQSYCRWFFRRLLRRRNYFSASTHVCHAQTLLFLLFRIQVQSYCRWCSRRLLRRRVLGVLRVVSCYSIVVMTPLWLCLSLLLPYYLHVSVITIHFISEFSIGF